MGKKNNKKDKKPENNVKKCVICSSASTISCLNCNKVHYCSKEHQKQDYKDHKNICKPFDVSYNDILGRYLVASKDIKQGELILKESPIVVGPSIASAPLCLKCYKPIFPNKKHVFCLKCGVAPLCSLTCSGDGHNPKECETFKTNPHITSQNIIQHCQIILPLRCLLLRESEPKIWEEFMTMESHLSKRRDTPIWRNYKMNVEDIIKKFDILTAQDAQDELLQKICGILDVNTFELRVPGFESRMECLRGVFLQAAMMSHDCIGNTHLAVDDNFNMTIHASVPIKKGAPIYFNYTNALQGTFDRQEHLKDGKYFKCTCQRCQDSTECGTYMSSILCVRCRRGLVSPVRTVDDIHKHSAIWKCSEGNCDYECRGSLVGSTVNCAKNIIEESGEEYSRERRNHKDSCSSGSETSISYKTDIRQVEKLIKKMLGTFSPGHSIILDLKQNLVGLYSEFLRQEMNPNRKYLHRKLELCKELIPVLERVEPGVSRLTGITLYEMHVPMVIIANREYDAAEISAEELLRKMLQAEEVLKKAISYLLYEPSASPERRLASNALNELKLLRKSVNNVEQIVENKKQNIDKRRRKKK